MSSTELVVQIFMFIGGLGMFLYGMNVMSIGLQRKAGDKLKGLLNFLTNNRFMGVVVGALITAVIQSSSATTVMIVGFVNSSLMTLTQAVGVIMGANIGTTITSWIVSLNQWGSMIKPETIAPVIMGIGAFLVIFIKSQRKKDVGEILIGFSLLFIGLSFMSQSMKPLASSPEFLEIFKVLGDNPILGILAGLVVTAVIQSSSASVGILQTLTLTGAIGLEAAIYITLGQNIGTCVTAILSSAGASRVAKRAAIIHLLFNLVGAVTFGVGIYVLSSFNPTFATQKIDSVGISIFHTIFNVGNTLLLFPFAKLLVKISERIIPITKAEASEIDDVSMCETHLEARFLETPVSAMNVLNSEVVHLSRVVEKNLKRSIEAIQENSTEKANKIFKQEKVINKMTSLITHYIVDISKLNLSDEQRIYVDNAFYAVSDMERVGDHCENIAEIVLNKIEYGGEFSEVANSEIGDVSSLALSSYSYALKAKENDDEDASRKAIKCEQKIDIFEEVYRKNHIERMAKGLCEPQIGVYFLDLISNLERISDHSSNLAGFSRKKVN